MKSASGPVAVLLGTRKGAFILRGNKSRRTWDLSEPIFLGHVVHHLVLDPRDGKTLLAAARTGHLGPTVLSTDGGADWKPLNKGCAADFLPVKDPEYGHDPHCMYLHPAKPDRLYQQNHCGIYRMERQEGKRENG